MLVYLVRHGIAEENASTGSDADRELTGEGRRKLRQVLASARDAGEEVSLIISSPLKRAIQTADVAKNVLKCKGEILRTRALLPDARVEDAWQEIRDHRDGAAIMLVGHNPLFSELAPYLLGCRDIRIDFKKGGVLCIDFDHFGTHPRGVLRWYLTPKLALSRQ